MASNDVSFAQKLLDAGAHLDPLNPSRPSAFYLAVWEGNFDVATLLFKRGADRDRMLGPVPGLHKLPNILGQMTRCHTRNAEVLGIPCCHFSAL